MFTHGQTLVSRDKKLRAKYLFVEDKDKSEKVKVGLSVSSNKGNSVWRNRIKRILRELIRKEKESLLSIVRQKNKKFLIIFSPLSINQDNFNKISLENLTAPMTDILNKLTKQNQF